MKLRRGLSTREMDPWIIGTRFWYQPQDQRSGVIALGEHPVEKKAMDRPRGGVLVVRGWEECREARQETERWNGREGGIVVAERREEKRNEQSCPLPCRIGLGRGPLASVCWVWQLEGHQ